MRLKSIPRANAAILLLLVCASSAIAQTPPRIVLRYDVTLATADFPNPAARLTFNGKTAWFLFDTGAGVHILAAWFVRAAGLTVDDSLAGVVSGVDSTGQAMPFRAVRGQVGQLEDGGLVALELAAVTDFAPAFEQFEIGGVISPQLLAGPGRAAALDLRVPELWLEPFQDAVRRLGAVRLPRQRVRFCGSLDEPIPNLVFAIPVTVSRRQGVLLLDSGAKVTKLVANSALIRGVRLERGGETTGISGTPQPYSVARSLRIAFADSNVTVDSRVADTSNRPCGADGLLGLDAIGRCALVLAQKDLAIRCAR